MLRTLVDLITSLKLTIVCLAAAMALIFAGTLAQVHLGIHEAQQRYFQSMFVWWPPEGRGFQIPIFPGGHLIGAVLLINLIAAHAETFPLDLAETGHSSHARRVNHHARWRACSPIYSRWRVTCGWQMATRKIIPRTCARRNWP